MRRLTRAAALSAPFLGALVALTWRESTRTNLYESVATQAAPMSRPLVGVADLGQLLGVQSVESGTWVVLGEDSVVRFRRPKAAWVEWSVSGRFRARMGSSELELTAPQFSDGGGPLPSGGSSWRWSSAQSPRAHDGIAGVREVEFDGGSVYWILGSKRRMAMQGLLLVTQPMELEIALDLVLLPEFASKDD